MPYGDQVSKPEAKVEDTLQRLQAYSMAVQETAFDAPSAAFELKKLRQEIGELREVFDRHDHSPGNGAQLSTVRFPHVTMPGMVEVEAPKIESETTPNGDVVIRVTQRFRHL